MGLREEFQAAAARTPKVSCPVAFTLETLTPDDRADLTAALGDDTLSGATIQRVLVGRGHRMGSGAVATHRGGRCSCRHGVS